MAVVGMVESIESSVVNSLLQCVCKSNGGVFVAAGGLTVGSAAGPDVLPVSVKHANVEKTVGSANCGTPRMKHYVQLIRISQFC